jgi:hypothetical protein
MKKEIREMEAKLAEKQRNSAIIHCCYMTACRQGLSDYERMVLLAHTLADAYEIVLNDLMDATGHFGVLDPETTPAPQN